MLPTIALDPKLSKRFLQGYPWVYANEIIKSNETKSLPPGECVQLTLQGKPISIGFYNRHSLIAFRALTHSVTHSLINNASINAPTNNTQANTSLPPSTLPVINTEFFSQRLLLAETLRKHFYSEASGDFYRLIHAEGDGLPGLIIDRFNEIFVVQLNTQGMEKLSHHIIESLTSLFHPKSIMIKRDSGARILEGLERLPPEWIGEPLQTIEVIENHLRFSIDISTGQKTGWFFDHRENRKCVGEILQKKPQTKTSVIDYYCYSGGFAMNAAMAGAQSVIAVDRSHSALENARKSAELNGLTHKISFIEAEVFDDMDERIHAQQRFDWVLLDPPAFVKSKKDLAAGLKGYEKLITKGLQLTAAAGFLLIASCSYHVKSQDLQHCIMRALSKTKRSAKIVKKLTAGPDHPIHPMLEESEYLKGFLIWVE